MKARQIAMAALLVPTLAIAGPQWTWEAGKQANNGAITIKSTNGSTTYSGTQNPTGAVAKVNQNAVTQPPTVIIQATGGGGQVEAIPMLVTGTTVLPACPPGYLILWSGTSTQLGFTPTIINAGGTQLDLIGTTNNSGWITHGWRMAHQPSVGNDQIIVDSSTFYNGNLPSGWAAVICSK